MDVILFFILSAVCLGGVLAAILFRNQAYVALFLVLTMASLAGLYALLDAPFVAVVQVIIYAGAIMVLFIFVVMMIHLRQGVPAEKKKWAIVLAIVLGLALGAEVFVVVAGAWGGQASSAPGQGFGRPSAIGRLLLTDGLYAFELTSVLLLASLVGAVVLAKKRERP